MTAWRAALGAWLAWCGAAWAQAPCDAEPPQWIERPTGEMLFLFYPNHAANQGVVGLVMLNCDINLDSTANCALETETPLGWDFGEAALALSRTFRIAPARRGGQPVAGGRLSVPISFRLPDDHINPVWLAFAAYQQDTIVRLPTWEHAPTHYAGLSAYPREALRAGVRGRGLLSCLVRANRTLNCEVQIETPADHGFGAAALLLAQDLRVAAFETDFITRHRATRFLVPMNFGLPPDVTPLGYFTGAGPLTAPPLSSRMAGAIYPERARAAGVKGEVSVLCTHHGDERPACVIEREEPGEWDFGAAALDAINAGWDAVPPDLTSSLPGDQLRITVTFD